MTSLGSHPRSVLRAGLPTLRPLGWLLVLLAATSLVLAVLLSGGVPRATPGLQDAGPLTAWMVPLARTLLDVTTFAVAGCLLLAGWLMPCPEGRLSAPARRLVRLAGRWALAWSAAAVCLLLAGTAQLVGRGVREVVGTPALYRLAWGTPQNRGLLLVAVAGAAVAVLGARARRPGAVRWALAGTGLALVPLLVAGHVATASSHYVAAQSLVVHVLAASLWAGGLLVVVVHLRRETDLLPVVMSRFSRVALWCFVAVALSGLAGSWVRLGLSWETWHSPYGVLAAVKALVLGVLGTLGAAHRRWALPRLAAGAPHAFARLAVAESALMAVATGLAVALARTAPPTDALTRATPPHANTFATVDRSIEPVSAWNLITGFRPDVLVLSIVAGTLLGYLLARRRLVGRGHPWPARRTACFLAAEVVAAWAMCGGLGSYSAALISAEATRLLVMGLVVPALLTWGSPILLVSLLRGASGTRPTHVRRPGPVNGLVALVLVLAAALMTPLLEASLRSPALHAGTAAAVLAAGWLFLGPLLGVDRASAERRDERDARLLVVVLALLLLVQAGHLWTSTSLFASDWFTALSWPWTDVRSDQRLAGGVVAAFAAAVLSSLPWVGRGRPPAFPQDRDVR
ncbi:cytochrome c oxidase assembly protein [Nocardioides panacis]|uniref:Cytochrome c oxidase assembly protein n=1 Tax=Nocardioides panacis TaxID=2849501 RepID=A0A975SZB0_9ACTN|nr:cytochrome c oxidase assembly protein [Nocardioides panacis]QWZ08702.1 cytochrome c oxidase assembly protein [Nocardioides panacis]